MIVADRVYLTLMFISPRGVISYDPASLRAMYVKQLMWIRSAVDHHSKDWNG